MNNLARHCPLTSLEVKEASLDRTLMRPQATYHRVDLRLHCTLESEVEASGSGSTASLWSLRPKSPTWALKVRAGDPRSESPTGNGSSKRKSGSGSDPAGQNQIQKGEENTLFKIMVQSVRFDAALGVRRRPASIPSHRST
ncbi:unnamed protein product [Caenorhabditis auriculariae]|uniref:Uncharacterized protein n=1 Tax=Caenorhabditis auriculariae TaxID=2777116 RepID=A0A8S1H272_9PELO|nr:unnamed protein product [Caenorhabditis auriculariae]